MLRVVVSSLRNFALPGLALLGLVIYWWWRPAGVDTVPVPAPDHTPGKPMIEPNKSARGDVPSTGETPGPATPRSVSGSAGEVRATRRDRAASDALRLALRERHRGEGSRGSTRSADAAPAEPVQDVLDKDYIRARIQDDLLPIAQECYESALEDDPKLAGKLVMTFSIVGDEEVGGVVDEAELDPSSDIRNPALNECMRESMLSLAFAPPEDGGTVQVTYPFEFAPGEK